MQSEVKEKAPVILATDDSQYAVLLDTAKYTQLQRAANLLASSDMVPEPYHNSIPNCAIAIQYAVRLQCDPMLFMSHTFVLKGKVGMDAQLMIALANRSGAFKTRITWEMGGDADGRYAVASTVLADSGQSVSQKIDVRLAKAEGWYERNGKWKTMTDRMLQWRSAAWLIKSYAPETILGLLETTEVEDIIDVTPPKETPPDQPTKLGVGAFMAATSAGPDSADGPLGAVREATEGYSTPSRDVCRDAPTIKEVSALIQAGKLDEAADLARSFNEDDRKVLEGQIKAKMEKASR